MDIKERDRVTDIPGTYLELVSGHSVSKESAHVPGVILLSVHRRGQDASDATKGYHNGALYGAISVPCNIV